MASFEAAYLFVVAVVPSKATRLLPFHQGAVHPGNAGGYDSHYLSFNPLIGCAKVAVPSGDRGLFGAKRGNTTLPGGPKARTRFMMLYAASSEVETKFYNN